MLVAIAAVVLAGAAAYLSYEYAHKADTRAQKNVQRVDVLVAKNDIAKGTTAAQALNSGLIGTKAVPRAILPPSAVANATDLTDKISAIKVPTVIVVGEEDQGTPVAASRAIQGQIAGSQLEIIKSAAHLSNLEQPEEFTRIITSFLARVA